MSKLLKKNPIKSLIGALGIDTIKFKLYGPSP